ncbi:hypothetical protein NIES4071_07520 [Calothrix sp. NIES-4071]|nr:hypothetical protein NIES4071_07520 [Calothrix sp. NIES-4071]BAZ55094.1 hypothetical protein NIES4105_07480 [Calothrix sp. NIES-4105]
MNMNNNLEKQIAPTVSCLKNELHDDSINNLSSLKSIYYDARHYKLIYENNYFSPDSLSFDIPFWIDMANQYGDSVLELCCGSGRISIPLAQTGKLVTGIDILDSMLSEAREKCSQAEWVKADVRNFDLGNKFSLIIFPFNSLGHLLDIKAIEDCFSCIRKHLKPEGRFIIDLENSCRQENLEFYFSKDRGLLSAYPDPDGKGTFVVTYQNEVDLSKQINNAKLFFQLIEQKKEIIQEVPYRLFFPQELEALLKYNGFTVESKLGSHNKEPFTSQSPNHIVISKLQE